MDTGGTPAYLAPEVIKAEGLVSEKSDVWSLGVLLYLLNFGTVPFKSADMQNLYSKIILGHFKFPNYEDVSLEVMDLIKRMLVVDIDKRLSIADVFKHQWFEELRQQETMQSVAEATSENNDFEIHEAASSYFSHLGFPENFTKQCLAIGSFNHLKACLDCLKIRFHQKINN